MVSGCRNELEAEIEALLDAWEDTLPRPAAEEGLGTVSDFQKEY